MATVIIVIHLMVIVALIAVVLLQRSDGGALGIGGGGGNFLATRGQGNVLTRSTAILAAAFFATSIALTVLARMHSGGGSILDSTPLQSQTGSGTEGSGGILNQLEPLGTPGSAGGTAAPTTSAPATGAPATSEPAAPAPAPAAPATPGVPDSQ
jgi:preprotein translocase subunit SecG